MPVNCAIGWKNHICGSSTVKWLRRTSFAQSHCSLAEGIFSYPIMSVLTPQQAIPRSTHILDLILPHSRYLVDNDPRQTPSKIHHLMHHEAQDTRGKDVVAHERIPRRPQSLEVVELDIVFRDLVEFVPIRVLGVREHGVRY